MWLLGQSGGAAVNRDNDNSEIWRRLPFHRGSSGQHIAFSDALVRLAAMPSIWWHAADSATLILGAAQAEPEPGAGAGRTVRRNAGGTAVLADRAVLGMDILLPQGHPLALPDVVEAYHWVGDTWVAALALLGVFARTVTIAEAREQGHPPVGLEAAVRRACFGTLSPYEVVVGNRKVVGLAQVRRARGILLQSGIHLSFDADSLARRLVAGDPEPLAAELRRRAVGLDELLGRIPRPGEISDAFEEALRQRNALRLQSGEWSAAERVFAAGRG